MTTDAAALRAIPLFQGMTDSSIEAIASFTREVAYPDGATLVRQGEAGDSLILIRSGSAGVERDGRPVRTLGAGDFLGEIALVDGSPRTATVVALEDIRALVIDRAGFARLMDDFPSVRYGLVSALSQRLRARAPSETD